MARRPGFFHHLHPPKIPKREARFRHTFGLGGISLFFLAVTLVTGVLELFYYVPSPEGANQSVQTITYLVPYGALVRGLHFWSAQGLLITCLLHLLRVVFTGAYKRPRRFNWLLGLVLLVLVFLFDFTGYALRWDVDISWALLVSTNLLKSIPLAGSALYGMVVGGSEIGPATVVRLYGWHVYALAVAAFFFAGWHLFRVRRDGGIATADGNGPKPAKIGRDVLVRREVIAALAVSIVLIAVTLLFPPSLGPTADFDQLPPEAEAPWFFLWVQQLLRLGPPLLMGVAIPLALLVGLAVVPYWIDRNREGVGAWFNREGRLAQLAAMAIVVLLLALTLQGALR